MELKVSDPIHFAKDPYPDEHDWRGPGWYFWDETWADRVGPYETYEIAKQRLIDYAHYLDTGEIRNS